MPEVLRAQKKAHTPGFQIVPPGLDTGVLDVFRELRQEHIPVGGGRGKGFRLADRLIRVVLAELQRDDRRSPQFVPDVLVRLGQLRAHPELVLPREIERGGDAEAREIGRGLRSNAPDILNRHFVEIEVQVGAADDSSGLRASAIWMRAWRRPSWAPGRPRR